MADLVAHLGIARASIYATFGGKHQLYLKALERYLHNMDPAVLDALSQPGPVLGRPAAAAVGGAGWRHRGRALTWALSGARAQGERSPGTAPRAGGRMLLVLMQGGRVLGRRRGGAARLDDAVDQALSVLG